MKKCNFGFSSLIVLAISLFLTSCSKQDGSLVVVPESKYPVVYNQGKSDTVALPTVSAVKVKHSYKKCGSDSFTTVDRYKAVNDTLSAPYTGQGTRFNFVNWMKEQGMYLVYGNKPAITPVVTPTPVDPPNGGNTVKEPATDSDSPFKFWNFGSLINFIIAICLLALIILMLMLIANLLQRAWNALKASNNNGGGNNQVAQERIVNSNNGGANSQLTEERIISTSRNGGANAHRSQPIAGVKKTVIKEERTTTHYYDDNRS